MNIILLGPNGSGKGTLATKISQDFNIPHISTGQLLRQSIEKKQKLGLQAQAYMNEGVLVPDELTLRILKNRLKKPDCQNGFILDGFPRSQAQAQALEKICRVDAVIKIELPFDECVRRLTSRRTCPKCGEIDNTSYQGFTGFCRRCGAKLFQRDDDKPKAIKTRLEVYEKQTTPLINFYSDRLFEVSNAGSPLETYKPVKAFLKKLEGKIAKT